MNDKDIATAVSRMLERQACNAPASVGLLETVKTRSRRRGIRRRLTAGVSGLAVAALAVTVPSLVIQPGAEKPEPPDGVDVCFDVRDDVPKRLMVTERKDGEVVEANAVDWRGGSSEELEFRVGEKKHKVVVEGWDVQVEDLPIEGRSDSPINKHEGVLGTDTTIMKPMLGFESGVWVGEVELTLTVKFTEGLPDDELLVKWAKSLDIHTKSGPCESE